jgi:segregation and condensation protein A
VPAAIAAPTFSLPAFEGPLDLLLHLIRRNQIDIYDIPIAEITRQYLDYLGDWEALDLAVAGEYLVMAATLVEIKSRMLLPQPPAPEGEEADEDPRAELVEKLLEYERYRGAAESLQQWEELRRRIHFRNALENLDDYRLPVSAGGLGAGALLDALRRVLASADVDDTPVSAVVPRRRVSLKMRMAEVLRRVRRRREGIGFSSLFEPPCDLYEIVLTFLAVLELLRLGRIDAVQEDPASEIVLLPEEEEAA